MKEQNKIIKSQTEKRKNGNITENVVTVKKGTNNLQ